MTASLIALKPADVAERLKSGTAVLIDIRESDEFARTHIPGALSRPLSSFEQAHLAISADKNAVFTCRTGLRTGSNCDRLAARVSGDAFILEGGLENWARSGLPVMTNAKAPLDMMRQVQIAAGLLVLAGVVLGYAIHPGFFGLSGFAGTGLIFAGATGFCGMARVLMIMPWNRRAAV